ncbi:MAG: tRNA (adenosine(37)-N6)-dimethylallyltransferase MiaA, partial [Prevotellaceae bacterium]|nr:tRNA (adenosine(37)-N6)-dimethylallyltransferase MiaA [Prevotellaceae bacterium]
GKDLDEYWLDGQLIPYHLIDIVDAGYRYNVFEYKRDFGQTCREIESRGKQIILCGGSGMYIDAVVSNYNLPAVAPDEKLRGELERKSHNELITILSELKPLHNKTDIDTKKRTIRAIEIEYFCRNNNCNSGNEYPAVNNICFEVRFDRETRRRRISERLEQRLNKGLIEEVETLVKNGLTFDDLMFYGLEYKFVGMYLHGMISRIEMKTKLETAIHQFAKRQMTWFRGMERKGTTIHVIDGNISMEKKLNFVLQKASTYIV